jgi:hypothetical protein
MDDAVRLSDERFRKIYKDSYKAWLDLYRGAIGTLALPTSYLTARNAFRQHPVLPSDLPSNAFYIYNNRCYGTCVAEWGSSSSRCPRGLPAVRHPSLFSVGTRHPFPTQLAIAEEPDCAFN